MNPTSFHIYLKILESLDRQYIEPEEFYDLETRVVDLEAAPIGDLSQIQSDVSSLQTSQTTQDTAITSLQGTSMVHTTNIANNTSAISALDTRVTQNETDIANLPGGGGGSAITVQDNGTPLSTDVSLVNFVGFTLTEPVADEITVTAIPTDLTAVNNAIAGNTANINTNSTNITANSTAITTNANNISSNDTDIANNVTAINGLDTRVTTAESNITALQGADDVITVQDEGTPLSTTVNTINFTGAGVTASHNAGVATVDIPGGGGGGSGTLEYGILTTTNSTVVANNAGINISFTNLNESTSGLFTFSNGTDLIITTAGAYVAFGNTNTNQSINATARVICGVRINNVNTALLRLPAFTGFLTFTTTTGVVFLSPGDVLNFFVTQQTGSNLTVDNTCSLSVLKVA